MKASIAEFVVAAIEFIQNYRSAAVCAIGRNIGLEGAKYLLQSFLG
ncbi:hypothetical protein NDI47_08765 [Microcoleus vaginatus GB1-A2]|nr:hypothetical protein [Microcoleus sp. FACHB-61]